MSWWTWSLSWIASSTTGGPWTIGWWGIRENHKLRCRAEQVFSEEQAKRRLERAERMGHRRSQTFLPGDLVYYWRNQVPLRRRPPNMLVAFWVQQESSQRRQDEMIKENCDRGVWFGYIERVGWFEHHQNNLGKLHLMRFSLRSSRVLLKYHGLSDYHVIDYWEGKTCLHWYFTWNSNWWTIGKMHNNFLIKNLVVKQKFLVPERPRKPHWKNWMWRNALWKLGKGNETSRPRRTHLLVLLPAAVAGQDL